MSQLSQDIERIIVRCPSCQHRMRAPIELVGKTTRCVKCGERLIVAEDTASAPASQSSARSVHSAWPSPSLKKVLIGNGLVTESQLDEAMAHQKSNGGSVYEASIELEFFTKEQLDDLMAKQPGLAGISLKNYHIADELSCMLPTEMTKERLVVPIDKLGKLLTLAMVCPLDSETIEEVQTITGLRVNPVLVGLDDITLALQRYFSGDSEGVEADFSWLSKYDEQTPVEPEPAPEPEAPPPEVEEPVATPVAEEEVTPRVVVNTAAREATLNSIRQLDWLPPSPQLLNRAKELLGESEFPLKQAAQICATDPATAASLLSIANAAAYGMQGDVTSVPMAIAILGGAGTARILGMHIETEDPSAPPGFEYDAFILESRGCASAARALAQASGQASPYEASTVGLLSGIGYLALAHGLQETFSSFNTTSDKNNLQERMKEHFGVDQGEAGAALLETWRLPERIIKAVALQARPTRAANEGGLTAVAALAFQVLAAVSTGIDEAWAPSEELALSVGLQADSVIDLARRLQSKLAQ